jgi:AraC family transcriptional regulator
VTIVKPTTRSFYESAVLRAIERVVQSLDDALDLTELARPAALAPLHFHRIFRGMAGETPLEMHRRLRLERAAHGLADSADPVTRVAFDAGYETHESFTRAFREVYSVSPSEFRVRAHTAARDGTRPPPRELAARSGVHFGGRRRDPDVSFNQGESTMLVDVQDMPELRVAAVSHVGPYNTIYEACRRLGELAEPAGLHEHPGAALVAIWHDDVETTPAAELRSDAGLVVPAEVTLPNGLHELRIPAGMYARTTHRGPYTLLGDTWARFMGEWLPQSGRRVGSGVTYELYRNTPATAAPEALLTDLYLPVA